MWLYNLKFLWLIVLIISYICLANARQIRYSRYNTEVLEGQEDSNRTANNEQNEVEATVREIKLAPYPASGYRPSRAFPLPNDTDEIAATTPDDTLDLTTTTSVSESDSTEISAVALIEAENDDSVNIEAEDDLISDSKSSQAPYPAAGFKPRIPFLLPTDDLEQNNDEDSTDLIPTELSEDNTTDLPLETETKTGFSIKLPAIAAGRNLFNVLFKNPQDPQENQENITQVPEENTTDMPLNVIAKEAPYPAAGYRPSQPFLLPTEALTLAETEDEPQQDSPAKDEDNSKHPVCGSSTNPLAPKPLDGEKEDPDSESIFLNGQMQRNQQILNIPVRFTAQPVQPLLITRPFIFTTHIQAW